MNQCEFSKVLRFPFFELPVQAGKTARLLEFVGSTDTSQTYVPKAWLFCLVNTWLGPGLVLGGGNPLLRKLEREEPFETAKQDCLLMEQYLLPYIPLPFAIPLDSESLMLSCVCTFKLLVWNPAQLMFPNSESMKLCEFCCEPQPTLQYNFQYMLHAQNPPKMTLQILL